MAKEITVVPFDKDEALRLLGEGWSKKKTADRYGLTFWQLQRAIGETRGGRPERMARVKGVKATSQQKAALDMRVRGVSVAQIALELEMSESNAYLLIQKGLKHLREEAAESAQELRDMECLRLDEVQTRLADLIDRAETLMDEGEDGEGLMLQTIDRLLKVVERRAKITGIETTRFEGEINDPWVGVIRSVVERMGENANAANNGGKKSDAIPTTSVPVPELPEGGSAGATPNRRSASRKAAGTGNGRANRANEATATKVRTAKAAKGPKK